MRPQTALERITESIPESSPNLVYDDAAAHYGDFKESIHIKLLS